jgi:hypothetical protein
VFKVLTKSVEGCKEKVLVAGSSLRFFNGRGIKLEELLQAHTSEGSKKKIVDFLRWDRIFGLQNQARTSQTLYHKNNSWSIYLRHSPSF